MQKTSGQTTTSFIHPTFDLWALGLLSIAVAIFCLTLTDRNIATNYPAQWAFYLSFVINYPHFAASYKLLYKDFGTDLHSYQKGSLQKKLGFLWVTILCPLLLLGISLWALQFKSKFTLEFFLQLMYITVGWHYVKQTFGISLLASRMQNFFFSKKERLFLKVNLIALWLMQWTNANQGIYQYDFYGLKYSTFQTPVELLYGLWFLFLLSLVWLCWHFIQRFLKTGERPPGIFFCVVGAMYVWYIPFFYHPLFFLWLPMFHSLQYLVVSEAYTHRKITAECESISLPEQKRKTWFNKNVLHMMSILVLGILGFELIPRALNYFIPVPFEGMLYYTIVIVLFINVHHYFIDSWIWRRDHKDHLAVF